MIDISNQVEIWKKIVDVQQHFNDLELRIRNFALVVTGAFIGLGGYAIKDGGNVIIGGIDISISGLVVFCSLLPLFAFYAMDRWWYHRLLEGAVKAAIPVEGRLRDLGLIVALGTQISKSSPIQVGRFRLHSKHKMNLFYGIIAFAMFSLSLILAFGVKPVSRPAMAVALPASSTGVTPRPITNFPSPPISAPPSSPLQAPSASTGR